MVFASDKMMATTGDYVFVSMLYRWFNQHTTGHFIVTIRFRSPIELISLRLLFVSSSSLFALSLNLSEPAFS